MKPRRSLLLAGLIALLALALSTVGAGAQDVYSQRTLELARKLHCPVCSGQTVADSGSELARQMRGIIEEKVQAGESDRQILDYFVARYGESILAEPPRSGVGVGLWWMPVAVVVIGALVVVAYLRERSRGSAPRQVAPGPSDDDELEAIAREVLSRQPEAHGQ